MDFLTNIPMPPNFPLPSPGAFHTPSSPTFPPTFQPPSPLTPPDDETSLQHTLAAILSLCADPATQAFLLDAPPTPPALHTSSQLQHAVSTHTQQTLIETPPAPTSAPTNHLFDEQLVSERLYIPTTCSATTTHGVGIAHTSVLRRADWGSKSPACRRRAHTHFRFARHEPSGSSLTVTEEPESDIIRLEAVVHTARARTQSRLTLRRSAFLSAEGDLLSRAHGATLLASTSVQSRACAVCQCSAGCACTLLHALPAHVDDLSAFGHNASAEVGEFSGRARTRFCIDGLEVFACSSTARAVVSDAPAAAASLLAWGVRTDAQAECLSTASTEPALLDDGELDSLMGIDEDVALAARIADEAVAALQAGRPASAKEAERARRAELRRERNRESARRSNRRRKLKNDGLKAALKDVHGRASALRARESFLREENLRLRRLLA